MNYQYLKPVFLTDRSRNLNRYKASAHRRLNAAQPKEEEIYVDSRNLWKASTNTQQKQYQSIKSSGLLSKERKMTFLRFNYRHSEEKNLCFPEAYQNKVSKPKTKIFYQIKKKMKEKENQMRQTIECQVRDHSLQVQVNWLEEFHETQKKKEFEVPKQKHYVPGTMNVNQLWGEKQLQESLGFLPCKRDRPKLLKLYSKELKVKRPSRCFTQESCLWA